ncbi:SCO7613 C-terminal domain-containing membrane protein [Micromonospora sp. WMMD558]|uniref:SCO7613 C-terminal domain-containing membrane protein n=1 Tax=Micromonospora sp. WMMD558 TaxID=3403462 RepID=UPI003BF46B4F
MENSAYPCPACGAPADLGTGCSGCGRPPYPPAAEVLRLDREIVTLAGEVERARQAYQQIADRLGAARRRRTELAAAIRAEFPAPARSAVPVPARPPAPGRPAALPVAGPVPARPGGAETSTRTVQGVLFVLGGLLLGTAAVVFTAVAWATVGVAGRALILAAVTALFLAVPLVAVRRGLRGTAETIAAVGLLLVFLDGYAAWTVDLGGVTGWPGTRYAALVGGAGAAVAAGYARLSRLTVPWFAALLAVQPVLPLSAAEVRPSAGGWAVVLVGVAVVNLLVVVALRAGRGAAVASEAEHDGTAAQSEPDTVPGTGTVPGTIGGGPVVLAGLVVAWLGYAAALTFAAGCALVPLAAGRFAGTPLLAGLPLLLVSATLLAAALLAGGPVFRGVAGALLVPVLAGALLRPVAELREGLLLGLSAPVVLLLAGVVRLLPARWRTGPLVGALVVTGILAQVAAVTVVTLAGGAVVRSLPPWQGAGPGPVLDWGWQLPVAVAAVVAAAGLLLPRAVRLPLAAAGAGATVLAVPAGWAAPWPAVVTLDLVAAVALLGFAVGRRPARSGPVLASAVTGAVLLGHGLLVGFAAPAGAGAALAVAGLVGLVVAALGRRGTGVQRGVAGAGLAAVLLVVPAGATLATFAGGAPEWWQARAALAAAALLPAGLLAVRRHWPDLTRYASTALAVAVVPVGLAPALVDGEPLSLYAAVAALLAMLGPVLGGDHAAPSAVGRSLSVVAVAALLPVVLTALLAPYGDVPVWSGVPAVEAAPDDVPAGLALPVLAAAVALAAAIRARGDGGVSASGRSTDPERGTPGPSEGGTAPPVAPGVGQPGGWRWSAALLAAPFLAAALPVLLRSAGAPWPVLPAAVLLVGVVAVLAAALPAPRPLLVPVALPLGLVFTGAGLSGLLATRAGTLTGLAALVVTGTVVGVAGRRAVARLAGALAAVVAVTALAVTASLAAGLPLRAAAFSVLAVAVLTLAVAAALPRPVPGGPGPADAGRGQGTPAAPGPAVPAAPGSAVPAAPGSAVPAGGGSGATGTAVTTRQALDAAAQAVAVVAFLLAVESLRHVAAVCVLWGAAVGLRLLRRGEPVELRWLLAAVAGGSELLGTWLLLAAGDVAVLEAYTLPAAALALVAGAVALRTRPGLTSWLAIGPGLAAGLLPTLASVLVASDPQPLRRLLLGLAALAAVLAGAIRRWQAPVVLGALTLTPLALHELARTWDLLPRWIFLAAGGLALIGLAATYERRRRDLARLRAAVGRMS